MKCNKLILLGLLLPVILLACTDTGSDQLPPQITAQGFDIDEVQQGPVGQFRNLRLRIESIGRINKLYIKERSYEVDLATTPERKHLPLFGIEKKIRLNKDVTLDFQNYINQKLNQPGQYVFSIEVVDKQGKSTSGALTIQVNKPAAETTPIETSQFLIQRVGRGATAGSKLFGLSWTTIDEIRVTIRMIKEYGGANKLAKFTAVDYQRLNSKEMLTKMINAAEELDYIEFDTANNAAVGQVLGVSMQGKHYMLKTEHSHTTLSQAGTTVILKGEYKF